jgi:hypothetical protein
MLSPLTAADRAQLVAVGIPLGEAERQLALFRRPPPATRLVRPCTVGDGIEALTDGRRDALVARYESAREAGRFGKFVPASGAASRMFASLLAAIHAGWSDDTVADLAASGDPVARDVQRFLAELDHLAFAPVLAAALARRELPARPRLRDLLWLLLGERGLGYAQTPKALLPFHAYPRADGGRDTRSAFAEHLAEAVALVRDRDGRCRLHFTVAPHERARFETALAAARAVLEVGGTLLEVDYSSQEPATDTLAAEIDGQPARRDDGTLVLRPGGHGALLRNLERSSADLVFIKNVDNVVRTEALPEVLAWRRALGGRLLELEGEVHRHLERLRDDPDDDAIAGAADFARGPLALAVPGDLSARALVDWLDDRLDRPLRVCGVVRNQGEPGGGPFWVAGNDGQIGRQIVEIAQIDRQDPGQAACLAAATHFNPVDLVCTLRDSENRPFQLARHADPATTFLSRKPEDGRQLQVLEHPGLWNGAMAWWNTVFVELPLVCFAPVKTVFDLLRPAHQPPTA